jgi:hypothetical protein
METIPLCYPYGWTVSKLLFANAYFCFVVNEFTRSTAQCGGGSFKNRKPIGEVSCCESRMAERSH